MNDDCATEEAIEEASQQYPVMKFFHFSHLPKDLRIVSKRFAMLALDMACVPNSAETAAGLRKLLEAKDCAVRAAVP